MDEDLAVDSPGLSPADDLARVELGVRQAALDEQLTMFDDQTAPKPPDQSAEATKDALGNDTIDMQRDTPLVDDIAEFDLSAADLYDVDL